MSYLGRQGVTAPLTSADIPDNSITSAKIVTNAVTTSKIEADAVTAAKIPAGAVSSDVLYLENNTSTQDLSGTYSTERLYFNDSYQLTGDVTVSGHLALGTVADADVVITQDSTERTITGAGTLEAGNVLQDTHRTSLTDMTGVLGSAVTGSPNLNLGNATFPAGHVLQVQSTTFSIGYTASNSSFTDIIGLSVAITPKFSNSKVLVLVNMCITASNDHHARIVRDSTAIAVGTGQAGSQTANTFGYMYNGGGAFVETRSMNFLDSPATTSATTYKVQAGGTATVYVNRSSTDTNAANFGRQVSTITVMEVAQ